MAYSLQVIGWHYASDVIGGYLVGAAWFALGVAILRAGEARVDDAKVRLSAAVAPTLITGLAGAGLAAAALALDPVGWFTPDERATTLFAAVVTIGAAGLAVAAAAAAALRQTR